MGGEHYPRRTTSGLARQQEHFHPTFTSIWRLLGFISTLLGLFTILVCYLSFRVLFRPVPRPAPQPPTSDPTSRESPPQVHAAQGSLDDAQNSLNISGIMSSDAAALPSPPDFAPWANGNHSRTPGGMYASGGQHSRPGSYHNGNSASPAGARPPRFPNIKDLQDQAASLDVTETTSVSSLCVVMVRGCLWSPANCCL